MHTRMVCGGDAPPMVRWWGIAIPAVLVVAALAGCGDGTGSTIESTSIGSAATTADSGADDELAAGDLVALRTRADSIDTAQPSGVDAVMDFQVGGDSTGCGDEPVETFQGVYYRYDGPGDLGFMAEGAIDGGEIGWPLIFCLPEGPLWTITAIRPDGSEETTNDLTVEYDHEFLPGDPMGIWRFTAEAGTETLTTEIEVGPATAARIAALDEGAYTAQPGDTVSYSLAGFDPNADIPVAVYGASEDDFSGATFEQGGTYLGQVEVATDETGAGILDLLVSEDLAPGAYYLVPDPGSEESQAVAPLVLSRLRADLIVH